MPVRLPTRLAVLFLGILLLLIGGCRSIVPVPPGGTEDPKSGEPLRQRIVILVHGDASYLYHTPDGTPHQADTETLREAFSAAQSMPRAEIFVFHQRPHDSVLGLFPRADGTLYHFRRGRLHHQTTYDQTRTRPFDAEAKLVRRHRAPVPDSSLFTAALYYGHAVPEQPRPGYHRSQADVPFGIPDLAQGLERLSAAEAFDAVVLSTCDGGTPTTLTALAPHVRHVLAAPGDLHLSYVDADLLSTVGDVTQPHVWTHRLAERAFDRLTERVTTAVTLATYDTPQIAPAARRMARRVPPDTSTAPTGARLADCRQVLGSPVDTTGVRVWHRPARFGPQADQETHSGWGCLPKRKRSRH